MVSNTRVFYVLNGLRLFSIISLLLAASACITNVVFTIKSGRFHFLTFLVLLLPIPPLLFLFCSEVSLFPHYFARSWPLFARNAGLTWLGAFEVVIGLVFLAGPADSPAAEQEKERKGQRRTSTVETLFLAAGVTLLIAGVGGMISGIIHRMPAARELRSIPGFRAQRKDGRDEESAVATTGDESTASAPRYPTGGENIQLEMPSMPERAYGSRRHSAASSFYGPRRSAFGGQQGAPKDAKILAEGYREDLGI